MNKLGSKMKAAFAAGLVFPATLALAGPPTMDAIVLPVDVESVVAAIVLVGGIILLAIWGVKIAFRLANKLFSRAASSV